MSCYLRQVKPKFEELGVDGEDKAQKKALDVAIKTELDMAGFPCNQVWAVLKPMMNDEEFWKKIRVRMAK